MAYGDQEQAGRKRVMRPEGRLDMASAGAFREELLKLLQAGPTRLVLDLGDVSFIDTSGLAAIIGGLKLARGAGSDLRIACPAPQARSVLALTTLASVLPGARTVEDALADFN